jgi:hypothetical protein
MGGPSRRRIFGDRVRGAKISAEHARQRAKGAAREADAAECLLWSEQMEGFGGPRSRRRLSRNVSTALTHDCHNQRCSEMNGHYFVAVNNISFNLCATWQR